ncbi:MAG TPA: efflux RND transporter periplasmic adaptor subunit [Clostridia bacterium]|nr:efflux RND transporter periplasmic adaptor subunit [Clostridia bacterium]
MKKKIIWIVVILVLASIVVYKIKSGGQAVSVELAKVSKGDIVEYVEETGDLMLETETEVYSTAAGRVTKVAKNVGEAVKAGETLVEIDNDLLLQIKALNAQKLSISAKYDEIKSSAEDEEIRRLSAQVRAAEATYEESKSAAENNKVLFEAGAISLDTLKSFITKLAAAEANLETAKSNLAAAQKGASENVRKQYEAQLSEIQAKIEQLEKKSEDMVVRSPIDGLVMACEVEEGNIVQMGSKLYEIGGSEGLFLESEILIEDIARVKLGSPVIIENEDLGIEEMKGTIRKIYPKAFNKMSELGIEQKRVKVEIALNGAVEELRPGYDMTVKIITQSKKDTLLIAEKAIFNYQGKDHVFINEKGLAKLRAIEKGLESNEQVEVLKGLNEGEEVLLSPDESLEEGARIKQ